MTRMTYSIPRKSSVESFIIRLNYVNLCLITRRAWVVVLSCHALYAEVTVHCRISSKTGSFITLVEYLKKPSAWTSCWYHFTLSDVSKKGVSFSIKNAGGVQMVSGSDIEMSRCHSTIVLVAYSDLSEEIGVVSMEWRPFNSERDLCLKVYPCRGTNMIGKGLRLTQLFLEQC